MRNRFPEIATWFNAALNFIYPEVCQLCGNARATSAQGFVCEGCRATVRFIEPPFCDRCGRPFEGAITTAFECDDCREDELHFRAARSAVIARELVLDAIHKYKYNRALWIEPFLAELLISKAAPSLRATDWDFIVPIPLYPVKEREREFNQAERLADCLGAATSIAVENRLLKRIIPTRTQTRLRRHERFENVRNAFALRQPQDLNGKRIVLVDDVFTTGATSSACAKVLCEAGAAEVCVWTVARGI